MKDFENNGNCNNDFHIARGSAKSFKCIILLNSHSLSYSDLHFADEKTESAIG